MRVFIGIPLPNEPFDALKKEWDAIKTPLNKTPFTVNPHVTMAFLDEVPEEKIETLISLVEKAVSHPPDGFFSITALRSFPNRKPTRIAGHVEIEKDQAWKKFVLDLREIVSITAPNIDRKPWLPHVTIIKPRKGTILAHWKQEVGPYNWTPGKLEIVKSQLTPGGSIHTVLHEFKFNI